MMSKTMLFAILLVSACSVVQLNADTNTTCVTEEGCEGKLRSVLDPEAEKSCVAIDQNCGRKEQDSPEVVRERRSFNSTRRDHQQLCHKKQPAPRLPQKPRPYNRPNNPNYTTRRPNNYRTRKPYGTTRGPNYRTRKPYDTTRGPNYRTRKPYGTTRGPYYYRTRAPPYYRNRLRRIPIRKIWRDRDRYYPDLDELNYYNSPWSLHHA